MPVDAAAAALAEAGAQLVQYRQSARARRDLIASSAELQERELIKTAAVTTALAAGLSARGVAALPAELSAQAAVTAFTTAYDQWVDADGAGDLTALVEHNLATVRDVLHATGPPPAPSGDLMSSSPPRPSRALVLGGGGVTGIAWEVGVLAGLRAAGVDLSRADTVLGTSAGAFVGAALTGGTDLLELLAAQSRPDPDELAASTSDEVMAAWFQAFAEGGSDPLAVGAAMGRIGRAHPEPVSRVARRAVVRSRLMTDHWPSALRVTALDADSGRLHVFDASSDVALEDALAASGAVPGVWPLEQFAGRTWIDGGMVSTANARLAHGHDRIVVVAPLPDGYGALPGASADVAALGADAQALLIAPDEATLAAIGANIYDPTRRGPAAVAGQAQGTRLAETVARLWS